MSVCLLCPAQGLQTTCWLYPAQRLKVQLQLFAPARRLQPRQMFIGPCQEACSPNCNCLIQKGVLLIV